MSSLAGFNAADKAPMSDYSAVAAQKAILLITESEMKATRKGDGSFLKLVAEAIGESQIKGRKFFINLNLDNPNKQAVDIAERELAAICRAVGIVTPQDSAELHNKPFIADIGVRTPKGATEPENYMKGYEPIGAAGVMAGTNVAATPAGSIAFTNASQAAAAPSTPAPAAAPTAPPWLRKQ